MAVSLSLANRHAQPAGRLSAVFAAGVGGRPRAAARGTCAGADRFKTKPQIALSRSARLRGRAAARAWCCWMRAMATNSELRAGDHGLDLTYVAGHSVDDDGVAAWQRHRCRAVLGPWTANDAAASRCRHQPVSVKALALGPPSAPGARSHGATAAEPLRSRFARLRVRVAARDERRRRSAPKRWLLIEWPKGEAEPTKYWLSTLAHDIAFDRPGRSRQATLAHRARLSGAQAGDRTRPLRGPRLARLSSPRHPVHRSLRFPDLRAGEDSPLWTACRQVHPGGCAIRWLPTPRLRRCGPSVTSRTQSQPCAAA